MPGTEWNLREREGRRGGRKGDEQGWGRERDALYCCPYPPPPPPPPPHFPSKHFWVRDIEGKKLEVRKGGGGGGGEEFRGKAGRVEAV